ncbi:FecR family protein [Echinicola sp. 20G]|uniref:FecR family protein n=1 Tax=Echinicola sp. 20G TaxID=2781961 RepID=UPI0019104339|nr:FecR domain-containing protein [Echinicola sp. 20G]
MMKSYSKIEDLLFDHSFKSWVFDGEPVENLKWINWVNENETNRQLYIQARIILLSINDQGKVMEDAQQHSLFKKIEHSIEADSSKRFFTKEKKQTIWNQFWIRTAAILMVVLLASITFLTINHKGSEEKIEVAAAVIVKANPKGQKSKLYLPDGSIVYLNSESEITYLDNFGKDNRELQLKGEAFFEVAHDTVLPFTVKSGNMVTVAVGTSFNVNAYQEFSPSVQLATGKVRVYNENRDREDLYLVSGEEAKLDKDVLSKGIFNPLEAYGWKNGVLSFNQMKFSEVKRLLERWYAVEITVQNSPKKDEKVSGEFKDASLENVLESLGYTMGFSYKIDRKKIALKFNANE